ncbi:MAG: SRPBCC family protein [Ilumatobacter sp.]|nr:SRPBCC family protein [Ilumatobacter sp.]MDG1696016.1 SRPBCC family protein [Ilumatobacter sp.]MDG2439366.1 SRPBCC family protein [Ilumatobacter sp.]
MGDNVTATCEINASAEQVWKMVSDLPRMGEWSPENEGGVWLKGADGPKEGVKFRGTNRQGKRRWKTIATIIDVEPGRKLTFRITVMGIPDSEWSYDFEPTDGGCHVTESWTDQRPGWFKPLTALVSGVSDRETHNRAGMEQTLEALKAAAESA